MKGSQKILLLLLGVLVALIVTLTTWVYLESPEADTSPTPATPSSMSSPAATFQKIISAFPIVFKYPKSDQKPIYFN